MPTFADYQDDLTALPFNGLLAIEAMPRELRVVWLPEASKAARAAKDFAQATKWDNALAELVPPVPEKK